MNMFKSIKLNLNNVKYIWNLPDFRLWEKNMQKKNSKRKYDSI